ncbi:serine/threonine-protein kinase [Clostridium pascui]|uniref:Stk1 family PASTA domain-containing Ser/Thr kinase n=1 Tax=Clostridium pascui TaxID=46609 RepID=UPI00195E4450|nr:Stk1 family PASTA domain-containing Ser/Thr kinase [Clostridium pascui]MBM7868930.1 serine/threonine-protein kinase [Clostridium pascui]
MVGTLLGNRYELLEKIGEGGMAEVYKAKCHLLNRFVAVKILKDELLKDSQFVDKFKREATAAASLSDNNIVNIYDVGSQNNIHYIVMEYVKGKTLKEFIREKGKLNEEEAINVAIQIAKALECAHRNNIIHRDIKPHNILVTEEGLVKVTDFGIAKATNSVTITNTSKVMGSAHYFSPEQAKGSYVDARTDIYSLGIVIYEMITGKVPYDADSPVSVALKHIQEQAIPPKNIVPNISENINNMILKSIEKEPIKRYQSIKEMLQDLRKVKNKEKINVAFFDMDEDRTRVMEAIKVDSLNRNKSRNDVVVDEDDDDYEEKNKINKKKRGMIIAITAVILALITAFASGYMIFNNYISQGKNKTQDVVVPKIVGLSKDEAKSSIESKNLVFTITETEKSDKPEGTVLRSYPTEGTTVKANSEVRVTLSAGKDKPRVPDLKEMDIELAKQTLSRYNLEIGNIQYAYDDNIPKNSIISQSPSRDEKVDEKTKVDVVVSKGVEIKYSTVPSLNGKTIEQAKILLANSNLKLGNTNTQATGDETLQGKIFDQSIEPGVQVKEGTTLNVTYYVFDPKLVPNPDEDKENGNEDNKTDENNNQPQDNQAGNNQTTTQVNKNNEENKQKGNIIQ